MAKNLFTKLGPTPSCTHSEAIATKLIEGLVKRALDLAIAKEIQVIEIDMLREQSMNKQTFTVEQAFARNPFRTLLNQDSNAFIFVKESSRPLSAKINTFKRHVNKPRNTRRSNLRYSRAQTIKSAKSIASSPTHERRKGRFEKASQKLIMLPDENTNVNAEEEQYIAMLRANKIKQQAQEREKKKFFKLMAEEQERNDKLNKKFVQHLGNKNFYYTKNGELMETNTQHLPSRLLKKTITSKTQTSKRQHNGEQIKTETVLVEYKEKENPFKKVNQTTFIMTSSKHLFYKSENCKYKVLD